MSLEVTGKIVMKGDTQQVSDKFKKREFVLELQEEINGNIYTNYAKMQLVQNKCDIIDRYSLQDMVKVKFNLKGNKWEKDGKINYMTNLDAWFIEGIPQVYTQYTPQQPPNQGIPVHSASHTTNGGTGYPSQPPTGNFNPSPETIDDLPF